MNKGPLRKIIGLRYVGVPGDVFSPDHVWLECGHKGRAWGAFQAHCRGCRDGKPRETDAPAAQPAQKQGAAAPPRAAGERNKI